MKDQSGLTYLRARYLQADVGRFTQKDPSGIEANPYLYAGANPISNIDPSGLAYNRALATSFARSWNQSSAPYSFPTTFAVFGHEVASILQEYYYDHDIPSSGDGGVDTSTPFIWKETSNIEMWTDCANFASHVLYQGGIRDQDSEHSIEDLSALGIQQFWNPKLMIGNAFDYAQKSKYWGISMATNPFEKWTRVVEFESFLYGPGRKQDSYAGKIPQFLNGRQNNDGNNKEWTTHLNKLNIQPGDIVVYDWGYGRKWNHVAVIVGWGPQTSFGEYASPQVSYPYSVLPREFWMYTCKLDVSGWKPRVVERDIQVQYNSSRSIDNTKEEIFDMEIFHIIGD